MFLLLIPLIATLIGVLIVMTQRIIRYRAYYDELTIKQKRFTIAILTPTITKPPGSTIYSGYISYLKKYASFEFETLECITSNQETAYKWAEYLANSNVDAILTAGEPCTRVMYRIMKTRSSQIPIISGAVPDDVADIPLTTMRESIPFTGSYCTLDWPGKIRLLKKIYPHLKHVTVLCRSVDEMSHANLKERSSITATFRKLHVYCHMHSIADIRKGTGLSDDELKETDLVIISLSSELMAEAEKIADECKKFNVPVFSTDLNNPHIFVGISQSIGRLFGVHCAKQTIKILEDGTTPNDIPLKRVSSNNDIVIYPLNAPPLVATTILGYALEKSQHARLVIRRTK